MKKNEIKNKIRENLLILAELEIEGIISYLEIPEDVKSKMEKKVSEYDQMNDFDQLLVQKRHQLALRAISKDESNEEYQIEKFEMKTRTERFCFKFNKKRGCKIDLTGLYEPKYNPTYVFGVNLARSYLPSSYWAKPDLDDVSLYKDLWHSNNKKDLRPHNEKDKDERRIDRCSFYGKYIVYKGYPLNPVARTGFKGRGVLSHWGPSKGVGAILYNEDSNKFEFLGVENGKYEKRSYICTPGGFVDPEEEFEYASKRELIEEALGIKSEKDKKKFEKMFEILGQGELVKFGNTGLSQLNTDNAWTESITYAFRIDDKVKEELKLKVGSDAKRVMWIEIEQIHKDINVKEKLEELFDLDERIDYILENFQACWVETKKKSKKDRTGKNSENKIKICYKLNSAKMLHMQDLAYFYLIKKYSEKTFLEILANKKVKGEEKELVFKEKFNEAEEALNETEEGLNEEASKEMEVKFNEDEGALMGKEDENKSAQYQSEITAEEE